LIKCIIQNGNLASIINTCYAARDFYSESKSQLHFFTSNKSITQLPAWFLREFNLLGNEMIPIGGELLDLTINKELCSDPSSHSDFQDLKYAIDNSSRMIPYYDYDYYKLALQSKNQKGLLTRPSGVIRKNCTKEPSIAIDLSTAYSRNSLSAEKWGAIISALRLNFTDSKLTIFYSLDQEHAAVSTLKAVQDLKSPVNFLTISDFTDSYDFILSCDGIIGLLSSFSDSTTINLKFGTTENLCSSPPSQKSIYLESKSRCFPCIPSQDCSYYQCHFDISTADIIKAIVHIIQDKQHESESYKKIITTNLGLHCKNSINDFYTPLLFYSHVFRTAANFVLLDMEEILPSPRLSPEASKRINADSYSIELFLNFSSELFKESALESPSKFEDKFDLYESTLKDLSENYNFLIPLYSFIQIRKNTLAIDGKIGFSALFKIFESVNYMLVALIELIRQNTLIKNDDTKIGARNAICDN
jgi:hypothetical protein